MDINKVLSSFTGVKRIKPNEWKAICPCHNDTNASLSITLANDKVLLHCHAECNTADILGASGLTWSDLGSESKRKERTVLDRITYGQQQHYGENTFIKDTYDYLDENGNYLYTKIRFEGGHFDGEDKKLIRYYQIDYTNNSFKHGKPEGCGKVLYRLPKLIAAVKDGFPVNIVEGEKDVRTLERFGWTATTPGGVSDWLPEFARYFKGADVRIFPDNDDAGAGLASRILTDLKPYAYRIRVVKTSQAPKGDVTDYLNEGGHDKNTLWALVNEAEAHYAPWVEICKNSEKVNVDKLAMTFSKQEHYLIISNPDGAGERLYSYQNGVYQPYSANAMKGEIYQYFGFGKATPNCLDNVYKMLMCNSRHYYPPEVLNRNENIINVRNGILDLKTMELLPHNPKYFSTCQLNLEYHPEANSRPVFDKYINDLCKDELGILDDKKKQVIQELMGLVLSNVYGYRTKKAAFLYSPRGNSGKSQLINLLQELLGKDRVTVVQLQDMNPKQRFALANIPSSRLITCGDQTSVKVSDSSIFKQLTGSDMVKVEGKGKDAINFIFRGFIMYGCNALPDFEDDKGDHLFERMLLIPCVNTIPETERDTTITDKMLMESSAIFNWALEGLQRLIHNGYAFSKSDSIDNTVLEFRKKIDSVMRFINENGYVITLNQSDKVNAKDFFDEYKTWCSDPENEIDHPFTKAGNFAGRLLTYGVTKRKQSEMYFFGITKGFINSDDDEIPF